MRLSGHILALIIAIASLPCVLSLNVLITDYSNPDTGWSNLANLGDGNWGTWSMATIGNRILYFNITPPSAINLSYPVYLQAKGYEDDGKGCFTITCYNRTSSWEIVTSECGSYAWLDNNVTVPESCLYKSNGVTFPQDQNISFKATSTIYALLYDANLSYTPGLDGPRITNVSISPANPITFSNLTGACTANATGNITFNYTWYRNGTLYSSGTTGPVPPLNETIIGVIPYNETTWFDEWTLSCVATRNAQSSRIVNTTAIVSGPPNLTVCNTSGGAYKISKFTANALDPNYNGDLYYQYQFETGSGTILQAWSNSSLYSGCNANSACNSTSDLVLRCKAIGTFEQSGIKNYTLDIRAANASEPYLVSTCYDLNATRDFTNLNSTSNQVYIELANDIDCSNITTWIPLGSNHGEDALENSLLWFTAVIDGKGHTIYNLDTSKSGNIDECNQFILGIKNGAILRNFTIDNWNQVCSPLNIDDSTSSAYHGLIAARSEGQVLIKDVVILNSSITNSGLRYVGGVVGISGGNRTHYLTIERAHLKGVNIVGSTCSGCTFNVGGFVGLSYYTLINQSAFIADYRYCTTCVRGAAFTGGAVGQTIVDTNTKIYDTYVASYVWSNFLSGGGFVDNVYATDIFRRTFLWGAQTDLDQGYAAGGANANETYNYWPSNFPGVAPVSSQAGTSKTTSQMLLQSTYQTYDFTDVWSYNATLPVLKWQVDRGLCEEPSCTSWSSCVSGVKTCQAVSTDQSQICGVGWDGNYSYITKACITDPANVVILPTIATTDSNLTCNYTLSGGYPTYFRWYLQGVQQTAYQNYSILPASATSSGQNWSCSVRGRDGTNYSSWVNSSTRYLHFRPIISNVQVYPDPADTTLPLNCNWTYSDQDNLPQNKTLVRWYVDNVLVKTENFTGTFPSLSNAYFTWNNTIVCSVLGYDGYVYSSTAVNDSVSISNSAPTFTSVSITPSPASKQNTLTCSISGRADADGDALTNYYSFYDSDNTTTLQAWSTDNTMDCEFTSGCQAGDKILCRALVSDGKANSTIKNATVSITNSRPKAQSVYIQPFSPTGATDINCTYTYFDIDGDVQAAVYFNWYRNETLANTSQILRSSYLNIGDVWKCQVTVNDGTQNSTAVTSTSVIIGAGNPTNILITDSGLVDEGENITFTWSWDSPKLPLGVPFTHYMCSTPNITSVGCVDTTICSVEDNSSTSNCTFMPSANYSSNTTFYLQIWDGDGLGSPIEPHTWYFNHKPSVQAATLKVVRSEYYNTFTCTAFNATDIDGDETFISYQFLDSDDNLLQAYSGTNTFITNIGDGVTGDNIQCLARASDFRVNSEPVIGTDHFRVYDLSYPTSSVIDEFLTITVKANNESVLPGLNLSIRSPFNQLFSEIEMVYSNSSDSWEYSFAPNIVGDWRIVNIKSGNTSAESYFYLSSAIITITTEPDEPSGGGGGGGSRTTIQEVPFVGNLTGFCGDGVCQAGENPSNCWEDCKINYDTLITCLFDDNIQCNWEQNWFPMFLIVSLGVIVLATLYLGGQNSRR